MSATAVNTLASLGAIFWSIQLLPQIWINYRRPTHTKGLQPSMMLFWAAAAIPCVESLQWRASYLIQSFDTSLGIYNILSRKSIALQIQPQILASLSLITWSQVYYYGHGWPMLKTCTVTSFLALLGAGVELLGILPFRYLRQDGSAPHSYLLAMAILSAVGLGLGVLRHYWDVYTHRSVRGISFIFVFLDAAGDLTSLLSVVFAKPIDVQGAAIYGVELALWMGIMALGVVYNLRAWITTTNASDAVEEQEAGSGTQTVAATEGEDVVEAASISSARSTSVFNTVGLRQGALQLLKLRQREVPVTT